MGWEVHVLGDQSIKRATKAHLVGLATRKRKVVGRAFDNDETGRGRGDPSWRELRLPRACALCARCARRTRGLHEPLQRPDHIRHLRPS